jgi:hypothetical protein
MNRHDTDGVSLAFGLAYLAIVGWWLVARWVALEPPGLGWIAGAVLVVLGVLGFFLTLVPWRGRRAATPAVEDKVPQS